MYEKKFSYEINRFIARNYLNLLSVKQKSILPEQKKEQEMMRDA